MTHGTHRTTAWVIALLLAPVSALGFAGAGASAVSAAADRASLTVVARQYQDPRENTPNAPDVTTVDVNDATPGQFTIKILTPNYQLAQAGDEITVYLNTDRNRGNNDGGAEYALYYEGTPPATCGVFVWSGTAYALVRYISCPYDYGPTFSFLRGEVGNPADFEFWIKSTWTGTQVYRDDAPNQPGWWLYDPSPPETTIASGSTGSTTATSASFTFSANEAGSTFQCSLDGAAFAACGSPAAYQNLGMGAHSFQVRAIDPSGNVDATPAARSWTVADGAAPSAQARSGTCCDRRGRANVRFTIADNSGRAGVAIGIYSVGRTTAANVCTYGADRALPNTYVGACAVPLRARGWLQFCAIATDSAGNSSPRSCKRLTFGRLHVVDHGRFVLVGKTLRFRSLALSGLAGGKASFRCRGCKLRLRRGRPVGTILKPGARIEVRVVKPRVRGAFIELRNAGGGMKKRRACLPPGMSGPVVSCKRTS